MRAALVILAAGVAATVFAAGAGGAETYSSPAGTIGSGTNYFSLPALPASIMPPVVFAGLPIENRLAIWCRLTQQWDVYPGAMSVVDWHMGHRLEADGDYSISFEGTQPAQEMSTCLNPAVAGLAFVSQPYDHECYWRDFKIGLKTNPLVKVSAAQAAANGWIEDYLIEGAPDSGVRITLDGAGGTGTTVKPWNGYWVTVKVGPQSSSLLIYWPTEPARVGVADAKGRPDGSMIALHSAVVTGAFGGCFYIESDDRSSGMRVVKPGHGLEVGMRVDVIGRMQTNGQGERYIAAAYVR